MNQSLTEISLEQRTQSYWRACQCLLTLGSDPERRREALRVLADLSRFDGNRRLRLAASRTVLERQLGGALWLLDRDEAAVADLPFAGPARDNGPRENVR